MTQVTADHDVFATSRPTLVSTVCRKVCQPTPVISIFLKPGWIFFFNTEAKSSGLLPFTLSEGKT